MHSQPLTAAPSGFISLSLALSEKKVQILEIFLWVWKCEGEGGDGFLADVEKINLDLGIGSCACASEGALKRVVKEEGGCFFTDAQFHELCRQIFIYNLIAYGFPVAFHLLIPIYNAYPSSGGFNREKSDHSSVMDCEPGRCRRTDGRKWRCSKTVVPLQKYCERHMHRGRQGSRKHVEPIERFSKHDSLTVDESRMPVMSLVASTDMDDGVSTSVQNDPSYRNCFPAVSKCRDNKTYDVLSASQNSVYACDIGNEIKSGISRVNYCTRGGDRVDAKSSFDDAKATSISSRKQNVVGSDIVGFTSARLGFSPNSVLIGAGKVGPGSGCTTMMEVEQRRCRRTDGKKWQCRRDALPSQKYCQAHMHRGAKRHGLNPNPNYSKTFRAWTAQKSCATMRDLDSGINLNTVPASPRHAASNNSSSTTSDATTISDENISFCLSNLSPQ